jgi:hypothetical protein
MADYSSYIMIDLSACATSLRLRDSSLAHGRWTRSPPDIILAGTAYGPPDPSSAGKDAWLIQAEDLPGPAGSEGWIAFTTDDSCTITMNFCDSYSANGNYAGISVDRNPGNRYALSGQFASGGDSAGAFHPSMPQSGHPVYCWFVVRTSDSRNPAR